MKKACRRTAFILMRELSWRCFGHKIDWRRLFLLAAILTISGILFQMLVHSYLLNNQSPDETDSSYPSLNSTIIIRSNEFPKEAILQQVHLSIPNSVILLNSSNKVVQSVSVEPERAEAWQMNISISRSKKDKKLVDTRKNTTSSAPHRVPSHKQVEVDETLNVLLSFF